MLACFELKFKRLITISISFSKLKQLKNADISKFVYYGKTRVIQTPHDCYSLRMDVIYIYWLTWLWKVHDGQVSVGGVVINPRNNIHQTGSSGNVFWLVAVNCFDIFWRTTSRNQKNRNFSDLKLMFMSLVFTSLWFPTCIISKLHLGINVYVSWYECYLFYLFVLTFQNNQFQTRKANHLPWHCELLAGMLPSFLPCFPYCKLSDMMQSLSRW